MVTTYAETKGGFDHGHDVYADDPNVEGVIMDDDDSPSSGIDYGSIAQAANARWVAAPLANVSAIIEEEKEM